MEGALCGVHSPPPAHLPRGPAWASLPRPQPGQSPSARPGTPDGCSHRWLGAPCPMEPGGGPICTEHASPQTTEPVARSEAPQMLEERVALQGAPLGPINAGRASLGARARRGAPFGRRVAREGGGGWGRAFIRASPPGVTAAASSASADSE